MECPTCGYQDEIQTSGVHEYDNGCTKVYNEDDEFHCPKCDFDDAIIAEQNKGLFPTVGCWP